MTELAVHCPKNVLVFQGFANEVFDAAYNITTDADSALGIFDDLVVILNVDVNVSGMNSDVTVSCFHFAVKMVVSVASVQMSQIHNIGQCSTTCHDKALHGTEHGTARPGTAWHSTARHSMAQHSMAQHSMAQHSMAQYSMAQHSMARHSMAHLHHLSKDSAGNHISAHRKRIAGPEAILPSQDHQADCHHVAVCGYMAEWYGRPHRHCRWPRVARYIPEWYFQHFWRL